MLFHIIFILLLFTSLMLESSILPFPLFIFVSLMYVLLKKSIAALFIVFFGGILLDALLMNDIGVSSLFLFTALMAFVFLERAFSFQGSIFTACLILAAVMLYGLLAGYPFSPVLIFGVACVLGFYIFIAQKALKGVAHE